MQLSRVEPEGRAEAHMAEARRIAESPVSAHLAPTFAGDTSPAGILKHGCATRPSDGMPIHGWYFLLDTLFAAGRESPAELIYSKIRRRVRSLVRVSRNCRTATTHQEIQIGSLICLQHMVAIKLRPSAPWSGRQSPTLASTGERHIIDFQMNGPVRNVESDYVP